MRLTRMVSLLIATLAIARHGFSGVNQWTTNGPPVQTVADLAVDPASPQTVYAACADAGLYKSVDGGGSWSPVIVDRESPPAAIGVIAAPTHPSTVYVAAAFDVTSPRTGPILYRSQDGGETWSAADSGLPAGSISLLTYAPSDPAVLFLKDTFDVYETKDGGNSWTLVDLPLYQTGFGIVRIENIDGIAIEPFDPSRLYVSAYGGRTGGDSGVYRSVDGGVTWTQLNGPFRVHSVRTSARAPMKIYAITDDAFMTSEDGGDTWNSGSAPCNLGAFVTDQVDRLYCTTLPLYSHIEQVSASDDSGATWSAVGSLPFFVSLGPLVVDPTGTFLHVGAGEGRDAVFDYTRVWGRPKPEIEEHAPPPRVVRSRS